MRDASVGFQCPSCIKEGARTTRSGRTAYGGLRSGNPGLTSIVLIATNLAVWLAILATGWRESRLVDRLALIPQGRCDSISEPDSYYPTAGSEQACRVVADGDGDWVGGVAEGAYWEVLTNAFTHVEIWHIGFNMLALWFLGPQLEMVLGRVRFLALYFISAFSGAALVYWLADEQRGTLGASAAIFGLLGALVVVAYKVGGDMRPLLVWLGLNVFITVTIPNISWQGHLGGFVGGSLVALVLVYAPRKRRTAIQVAGLSALAVLVVVAMVARTAALA